MIFLGVIHSVLIMKIASHWSGKQFMW
jgi:hypothetical protein